MMWKEIKEIEQVHQIKNESYKSPVVIFKHSTRCSISSMALNRLERSWKSQEMDNVKLNFLDLISYRNISKAIADMFQIMHQSPQVLIIKDGECVYHASHMEISYQGIKNQVDTILAK